MPAPPATPAAPSAAPAAAPATQTRRRAIGTWAAIGGAMLVVGIAMAAIAGIGQLPASGRLDADAAAPDGARAIVQILSERGVDVVVVHSREDAGRALSDRPATLAIGDTAPLEDATIAALAATADDVVLLEPRSRDLRLLLDGSTSGGAAAGPLEPACDLAEAERSGAVSTGIVYVPGSDAIVACYPSGDGYGLLVRHDGERRLAALDAATLLTNEHLAQDGNAALGLNLLGRHARLVWYLPGAAESEFAAPSLGDLTPSWVTPAMAMLTIAAIAAAVWRGRRFGPLVPENLPVTVRAGETTEGRARLYARAADPAHAADELRIAALRRLGRLLGLGPTADARTIADTAAAVLGADRHAVHGILLDEVPADDRALVDLVDRLHDLDDRLTRALRPMTPHPSDPSPHRSTP